MPVEQGELTHEQIRRLVDTVDRQVLDYESRYGITDWPEYPKVAAFGRLMLYNKMFLTMLEATDTPILERIRKFEHLKAQSPEFTVFDNTFNRDVAEIVKVPFPSSDWEVKYKIAVGAQKGIEIWVAREQSLDTSR